jgi:protein TonB
VIAVPNDVANLKKAKSPSEAAPDSPPPSVAGVVSNTVPSILTSAPVPKLEVTAQPIRISSGSAQQLVVHQVVPRYPTAARQLHVQGTVVLQAVIGKDGSVQSLHALTGHPLLIPAAVDAVKQWRFKPYNLNGVPVEADTQINVKFGIQAD